MNTATFDIFRFADFSYNTRAATSATEHARAIDFFVMLAYAVPKYRAYLLAPNGVHLLVQNIKSLVAANPPIPMLDLCGGLANVSQYSWCVYSVALDVCPALVNLLMYVLVTTFLCLLSSNRVLSVSQNNSSLGSPLERVWGCELIIMLLRNLAISRLGGRQAIEDATTDELRSVLPTIETNLRRERGDAAAQRTRANLGTLWPQQ